MSFFKSILSAIAVVALYFVIGIAINAAFP